MSMKRLTCDALTCTCLVLYTTRCSFAWIFEVIGGLMYGLDGLVVREDR